MDKQQAEEYLKEEVGEQRARWIDSKHAEGVFAMIAFAESVFAPIIIDPFLVALILTRREKWLRYVTIAVVFSVLGGIAGYLIGLLFYDLIGRPVIEFYNMQSYFDSVTARVSENAFVFVLIGALTPIPYKLVAIASGVVSLNFTTFIVASIVGRILRLGLVGWTTYLVGPRAVKIVRQHLLKLAYLIAVILLAYIALRVFFPSFSHALAVF